MQEKKRKKEERCNVRSYFDYEKKKKDIFQISLNTNFRTINKIKLTKQNQYIFYKILKTFVNIYDNKYNQ